MHQVATTPLIVALAIADALPHAAIGWPSDVVDAADGHLLSRIRSHAGYDGGMFCEVTFDVDEEEAVGLAIEARIAQWEAALAGKARMPGLAPMLSDYAEALYGLGTEVVLLYPNGLPYTRALFCGIDIFGRATARLEGAIMGTDDGVSTAMCLRMEGSSRACAKGAGARGQSWLLCARATRMPL